MKNFGSITFTGHALSEEEVCKLVWCLFGCKTCSATQRQYCIVVNYLSLPGGFQCPLRSK